TRIVTPDGTGLVTICKTRVVSLSHQQMLRLDQEGDPQVFRSRAAELSRLIDPLISEHQAVVLSDYDKGAVTKELSQRVIQRCREQKIPCIVDSKSRDFSIFRGATVLTPNVIEAGRACGESLINQAAVERAASKMQQELDVEAILITQGADGMTLCTRNGVTHIESRAREVADITGAGDTVAAVLAAATGCSWDLLTACRLANMAAGISVGRAGTYPVKICELDAQWRGRSHKIVDLDVATEQVHEARRQGKRIVFTNGCFDILHAGHLACLEEARRLGDFLIVGLNTDRSVRGLKGAARPIISEHDRAALLAGLACVDMIIGFDEPTPIRLIERLLPDVLVKGGDYQVHEIAGSDVVLRHGGEVRLIPLVGNLSTTSIVSKVEQ
ncbi:MAG: D-glycero-beta-D-manno-heptose 1-phosphate adenylyltransferase, partial [Schlesneria sp.]